MDYDHHYQWLVADLCAERGSEDIRTVLESQHIRLNDGLIGFAPDLAYGGAFLSVFVELEKANPGADSAMFWQLLAANMDNANGLKGSFSIHPQSNHVVYRVRVDMREISDGVALEAVLASEQATAREAFESLMAAA